MQPRFDGFQPVRPWSDRDQRAAAYRADERGEPARSDRSPWHWLLAVAVAVPLAVPFYNRLNPRLFGIPFFYWWQIFCAVLTAVLVGIVYAGTRDRA